ncbi:MAG: hypothetical protein ACKVP3_11210 [Hyphomicrobiaceae bacterium]
MIRLKLWTWPAIIAMALTAGASAASAQVVIQYGDPYYDDDRGPPVVYQDYYGDPDPDYRLRVYEYNARPSGPNGCGTYYFWNGARCVDARYRYR